MLYQQIMNIHWVLPIMVSVSVQWYPMITYTPLNFMLRKAEVLA